MYARAGACNNNGRQDVEAFTRAGILHAVRDAWVNPFAAAGRPGRPRERHDELVLKIAVFQEFHDDGLQTSTTSLYTEIVRVASQPPLLQLPLAELTFPCLCEFRVRPRC